MIAAVEAVKARLLRATSLLEAAEIPYAVIGGNAVAAWVARIDIAAVRNTQDVDLLIRRDDFGRVRDTLEEGGFVYRQVFGVDCFLESEDANPRDAVHIVFANEKVKPADLAATADVNEVERADDYWILQLESLVKMKLTSYRDKDRTHLRDMIEIELIDATWPSRYPAELAQRLQALLDDPNG